MLSYRRNSLPFLVFSLLLLVATGNIPEIFAQCPTITVPSPVCAGDNCGAGTPFTVGGPDTVGITKYFWDFGDPSTQADTSNLKFPSYRYEQPGTYNPTLTITRGGVTSTCPVPPVTVQPGIAEFTIGPDNNLGPQDEEICKGSSITLTPQPGQGGSLPSNATYLWSTGATTQTITVPDSVKCYSLTITDPATGCSRTNRVNITSYKPDPNQPPPPKEESRWYFGNQGGIIFKGGTPEPFTGNLNAPEGTSVVSGSDGRLLFYTDGRSVYDRNGNPMKQADSTLVVTPGGSPLNGSPNATQGVLIVAQPGCNDCDPVYYIFTTNDLETHPGGTQLSYSVVDMRLRGGLGMVTVKDAPLFSTSTERVVAVRGQADPNDQNAQETTYIITHDFGNNTFRVYPLTPQGVGQPKTYNVGSAHSTEAQGEGYIKAYDDKIVVVIPGDGTTPNKVEIFDFDNTTGAITERTINGAPDPIVLDLGQPPISQASVPPTAYGVELVGEKLFVSLNGGGTVPSQIIQYTVSDSITADSIRKTGKIIVKSPGNQEFGALQLDPYGRLLYLAVRGQNALAVINNPAGDSATVNFQLQGQPLNGGTSQLGLPNTQPPNNQGYGQDLTYEEPPCTLPNTPVAISFRAQPDRAGGDPTKSTYLWRFPNGVTYTTDSLRHTFPGPGTYTVGLTIFNDCIPQGEVIPDKQIIIPLSPPQPNLRDTSGCAGTPIVLDAYPGTTGPTGLQYFWTAPSGQPVAGGETFNATQSGTYSVTVVGSDGQCIQQDVANVNFKTIQVNLAAQTSACGGAPVTLDAGNPGLQYAWSRNGTVIPFTGQVLVEIPPAGTTTYSVTVTDPITRCTATAQTTVTAGTKPQINTPVVKNTSACSGVADGEITLSSNDPASTSYQYEWSFNGTRVPFVNTAQFIGVSAGTYQARVFNSSGCDTTLTIAVGTDNAAAPKYTVPPTVQLSCADNTGSIDISLASGPAATSFVWRDRLGNVIASSEDLTNQPPAVYTVTVTQGTCSNVYQSEIKADPNKPAQAAPTFIVTGCGKALLLANYPGDASKVNFAWSGPGIPAGYDKDTITVSGSGSATYTLQVTSKTNSACFTTAAVNGTFPASPGPYDFGSDPPTACAGDEVLLNPPLVNGWDEYIWTLPGGGTVVGPQYRATVGGSYTITVRDNETGCTSSDQVTVTINPPVPTPTATNPSPICTGTGIPTLTATATSGNSIKWYSEPNGSTAPLSEQSAFVPNVTSDRPGTYVFYAYQFNGNCRSQQPVAVTLTVTQTPQVNLGEDRNICQGQVVELDATYPGAEEYRWSNGLTTHKITATRTGTYSVQVRVGTCTVTEEVRLTFVAGPKVAIPRREVPLCRKDAQPNAVLDAGPGADFVYEWRRAVPNAPVLGRERTLTVTDVGDYTVSITNSAGAACVVTDTIRVAEKCEPRVLVPDAFAPGSNDPRNKELLVFGDHVGQIEMRIFNRWGELIYARESDGIESFNNEAWDGTYLGKPVPAGTYVWQITYTARDYPDREPRTLRGGVLIIR